MRPTRRLLLVGEGNFSFSASLCDASNRETCIIATCYESEERVSRQALAKTNIQHLRGKGVEVGFCVDCTKLKDYFLPAKRNFDCIYFNFPHYGRKAGVTKNRELLMKFFCSCADVLTEKGEVHVALCKGQGGTPADQPMREWHNSWQVVALAAGAGFILSDVHPFNLEDVHGYKCTGYRSQDKSFSVEGALNHIFTRGLPFPHPRSVICQTELEGKRVSFQVPEIFVDKINRHFLDINSDHPVRTINEKLIAQLSQTFPLQRVDHSLSLLHQGCLSAVSQSNAFWIIPNTEENPNSDPIGKGTARGVLFPGVHFCRDIDQDDRMKAQEGDQLSEHYLRSSLLVHVQDVIRRLSFLPGTLHVLSGPVFRKCLISPRTLPVFHETLFMCAVDKGTEGSCIQMLMDNIKYTLSSLLPSLSCFTLTSTVAEPKSSETIELNDSVRPDPQLDKTQYFICVKTDTSDSKASVSCIGAISAAPCGSINRELGIVCASVNLDLVAMQICGISDWRMLWTVDERFLNQFIGGELGPFKSFSLYPPSYVHDVSFWVPECEQFDEVAFHTIARCVSQETVVSIQLLDSFQHPQTGQISLCYRLTFQSCDKALTRQQVAEMQLQFRKEIGANIAVTLR
ncbi:ferredoxin-fold anticodon-binding domain-containing protein 1-like isoform X4 [Gopherus flavomarginatus]|uniref:ferredoxin-fold anticodon-binding domain-containing protein 1-like isoform X4 n=1 Tax=Gopherus flavomarginatus TaxID=286002 RepID=UPI0021CBD876|nr:ferredoxin-fold anticodon-binding domain-containing protein 1-like isoform X4 [Gopherus flavomarginatus]XP_050777986.1 ferredoxin-fold anticodon-binding domain-containing protein 1-like isoform X4 [Gopherus flavomarginatus]